MIRTGTFSYVPWDNIEDHHRKGWMVVADLGLTHGQFSVLMWRCECGAPA